MSNSSFQSEIPKARINLKLDLHTGGASKKTELPLKLLVAGDFSNGQETAPLSERKKVNLNKNNFDSVLSEYSPIVNITVKNTLAGDGSEDNINLTFQSINDFSPEQVSRQIPQLKAMLSMRNLLRDLKANLLDNQAFRKELEKILLDPALSAELRAELSALAPKQPYRVKPDFDREGTEQGFGYLWLRMAKPYAGDTLGWHTPLIDGTEVAIAYSNGDIDLPYIAYALHDSEHPDLVNRDNHTRNVLRTPANNKLRMEDKRGEEHIKLATEYGKTQLNSGHLVDNQGKSRGTGSELRTDEYGSIRAAKGLFASADGQPKAQGEALDMDVALKEIDRLNQQLQQLEIAAEKAQALKADVDSQIQMFEQRLKPLNEAVLFSAPEGMTLTSGEDMQLAAARNVAVNAGGDISVGTMGNLTALAGEKLGLFARTGQLSIKSGEGPIDIQAQNASLRLFAEKKLTLSSVSDILFAGKKRITLIGGGSYLRLEAGKVEYGTTASYIRKVKRTMAAGSSPQSPELPFLPGPGDAFRRSFILVDDRTQEPISNIGYELTSSIGKVVKGFSCEKGLTGFISHTEEADIELTILKQNSLYIG
ncbi:TPA: type VI secretion system contractile sheath small subunit [Enterobacter ludwigii]|nr:type VI secretion system contractile sheath small subunit [Enterobacter ludwigii]